ncbi:metal-dependent hydrolase [Deinococcus pimensis]|uniref:metal-dependent hydrolase n=1 Tax=Deinococcus pimensis TaxID=309888 RepID=UPI0004806E34|nr:metal-dependent hydrolase [Deinococcus pimensis]
MRIQFLGHSAFLIETGDHRVLIDPFIQGNPRSPVSVEDLLGRGVSTVVVTHAHGDHWGNTMDFARAGATVVATAEIGGYAAKQGAENAVGANIGGTVRLPWGSVRFTPAWHSSSFPDGTYGGMPTGVVIEAEGKRVYHAGDTCLFSDMRLIGDLGLDVAILPIGDHYTMGPEDGARCLDLLRPKHAVPMHFGTFGLLTGDPEVFAAGARERGVEPHVLAPGDILGL